MKSLSKARAQSVVPLYQIKITLKWSKPAIWRRVVVRADMRLDRLHDTIQIAMGWEDCHLHQFVVGRIFYGMPDPGDFGYGKEILNERRYAVADLAPAAKAKFVYEYDFGDGWEHDVNVEKVLPHDASFKHPVCLAGKNACPPEDCGGMGGYYALLETLADPQDAEHEEMLDWIGGEWDATSFDLDETNAALKRIKA
ncbi:MAG TPA: plasmid pRiA4b ORF-3 family protein [Chthoniobacterales bacterium]